MFSKYFVHISQKSLPCFWANTISFPFIISAFCDRKSKTHLANGVCFFLCTHINIHKPSARFYLFRSSTKKPSASFNIEFAFFNSAFSLINLVTSSLDSFVSFGLIMVFLVLCFLHSASVHYKTPNCSEVFFYSNFIRQDQRLLFKFFVIPFHPFAPLIVFSDVLVLNFYYTLPGSICNNSIIYFSNNQIFIE